MLEKQLFAEAMVELHTVRDLVRFGASQFNASDLYYGHGTDNAWDEAVNLVLYALHMPPQAAGDIANARITATERQKILRLFERRIKERIPAAYLTHRAWFAGIEFYVDERVLIPRSPMAELIEQHFTPWIEPDHIHSILDLCTGSGCIAIACAEYFPEALVDAIDISEDAIAVANMNVENHGLEGRVKVIKSDIFNQIPDKKYDLIISNPPYVDAVEMRNLPAEYHHEPALGLAGGENGLSIVIRILQQAHKHLNPQGVLIVEVGNSEIAVKQMLPDIPFVWLEFARGGQGVFLLTADQLRQCEKKLQKYEVKRV